MRLEVTTVNTKELKDLELSISSPTPPPPTSFLPRLPKKKTDHGLVLNWNIAYSNVKHCVGEIHKMVVGFFHFRRCKTKII